MSTTTKNSNRLLTVTIWCGLGSAVVFLGIYVWMLYSSPLNPPDGWQHIPVEQRYELVVQKLRIVLDFLPTAAFVFAMLAYFVWQYLREQKDKRDV